MFSNRPVTVFVALFGLLISMACALAQDLRQVTVRFPTGSSGTKLQDSITGYQSVAYRIDARAGQLMEISLATRHNGTYFNVYEPGRGSGDEALAVSELTGPLVPEINRFAGALPKDGAYTVVVYMVRAAARRNEKADYTLGVSVSAKGAAIQSPPAGGDFADSLAGGPDFWEVHGVEAGDQLNVRQGPNTHSTIVARVNNGMVLANRGCRIDGKQRWCQVGATDGGNYAGWVNGRYLREGSPAVAGVPAQQGGDALVAGTPYNATGMVRCVIGAVQNASQCSFGVIRFGGGTAEVVLTRPDGGALSIHFVDGQAVAYDRNQPGQGGFSSTRVQDLTIVNIGPDRYELVDAIVFGG